MTTDALFFDDIKEITTEKLYQYDIGQKLKISGFDINENTEVHFKSPYSKIAKIATGTLNGSSLTVVIPDEFLESAGNGKVWVCSIDENEVTTIRTINIPIVERAKPDGYVSKADGSYRKFNKEIADLNNNKANKEEVSAEIANAKSEAITAADSMLDDYDKTQVQPALAKKADKADVTNQLSKLNEDLSIKANRFEIFSGDYDLQEIKYLDNHYVMNDNVIHENSSYELYVFNVSQFKNNDIKISAYTDSATKNLFVDEKGAIISDFQIRETEIKTIPLNAETLVVTNNKTNGVHVKVTFTSKNTIEDRVRIIEENGTAPMNPIPYSRIAGLSYERKEKPVENVTNIFDKNTMVFDGYECGLSGFVTYLNSKSVKIPIISRKTYAFWANEKPWKYTDMGGIYIYTKDNEQLCKFFIGSNNNKDFNGTGTVMNTDTSARGYTFTAPEGSAYLCFTACYRGGTDYTDVIMVEEGNTCHDYVGYDKDSTSHTDLTDCEITKMFNAELRDTFAREKIKELEKENKPTQTTGMKWTVLGDSISVNTSHTDTFYHDILAEEFGLNVVNMAQSGSGFPLLVSNVCPNIPKDTDIITVMMGTNDVSRELGNLVEKTGMYGILYNTILYIVKNFPNAKFGVITPVPRGDSDENYKNLRNLAKAIKEVCDELSVPCLYLTVGSGMYPQLSECRINMYSADGVHPNKYGQKRMASAMRYWFKSLIEY